MIKIKYISLSDGIPKTRQYVVICDKCHKIISMQHCEIDKYNHNGLREINLVYKNIAYANFHKDLCLKCYKEFIFDQLSFLRDQGYDISYYGHNGGNGLGSKEELNEFNKELENAEKRRACEASAKLRGFLEFNEEQIKREIE